MGQYFLTIFFVAFDVVILSDSNSNFNNFIEVHLSNFFSQLIGRMFDVSKFFVDAFKNINFFLLGSILINSQPSPCSIAFVILFHSQYSCHYDQFHQFLF